jgi:uncharacterized delta-60 repeat protein
MKESRPISRKILAATCLVLVGWASAYAQTDVDTFNPGANGAVHGIAVQPDGKIVLVGGFDRLGGGTQTGTTPSAGQAREKIGRVNPDGSLDHEFNPGAGSGILHAVAIQPDGKILVGGSFSWLGGGGFDEPGMALRRNIGRLNADGSVDLSFDPGASLAVNSIALQPDGKIIVAGCFTTLGGGGTGTTTRRSIGRLHADGSLDTTFDGGTNGCVDAVAVQPDGKILVGGGFSTLGGGGTGTTTRYSIGRLNSDGSLDASFNAGVDQGVDALALQPDGKILVGGSFQTLDVEGAGTFRSRIGRLNADGSLDMGFDPGSNSRVHSLFVQPDGKIIVGGSFTRLGGGGFPGQSNPPRLRIGRLHADGSLDQAFNPGAESQVYALAGQADGKILVGGSFLALGAGATTPRFNIGRVDVGPPVPPSFSKVSPAHAGSAQPLLATLTWQTNTSASNYDYCYDAINNGTCDGGWLSVAATSAQIGPLSGGTTYYWQVRAHNEVGTTEANSGSWWSFTTSLSGAAPTAINDAYTTQTNTPLAIPAPGVLANDVSNGGGAITAAVVGGVGNGSLTLNGDGSFLYTPRAGFTGSDSFTYRGANAAGSGNVAIATITVNGAGAAQPATGLVASSIVGNVVTLRWNPPLAGLPPTDYVLEGGVNPGDVLASIPLGSTNPIHTFTAPTGAFYLRLHTLAGASRSDASNEIRVFVNVPAAPSAPADLIGLVDGASVALAWRNTFAGGAPTALILDVTGSMTAQLPLGLADNFAFNGVPGGTYTLAVRAMNASGTSDRSNTVTLTFPSDCSGPPLTPANFLAYRVGNTIYVVWDPAASGPAPTGYVLNVGGSVALNVPSAGRALSGTVGPGVYLLSVSAANPCGASETTTIQTVVIP